MGVFSYEGYRKQTNMQTADRLREFVRQAGIARERAATAEAEFRSQWLRVAEMWEMLAKEYTKLLDGGLGGR